MKITATNTPGRILLLLRPGKMDSAQLKEAFPTYGGWLYKMNTEGLIQINDDFVWSITDAGRAACPNRRDAKLEPLYMNSPLPKYQSQRAAA